MKFYCIVNQLSGSAEGETLKRALEKLFLQGAAHGKVVSLDPGNVKAQIEESSAYEVLLLAGGDGTISKMLPLMLTTAVPIGILPLGVGNDLAREIGVLGSFDPEAPETLLGLYSSAPARELSVWKLSWGDNTSSSMLFCNYLSFGFEAVVVEEFDRERKEEKARGIKRGRIGHRLSYLRAGLKCIDAVFKNRVCLRNDSAGTERRVEPFRSLVFSNIQSMMGLLRTNSIGTPFDDSLEFIRLSSLASYARMFFCPYTRGVERGSSWELISAVPLPVQVDGEPCSHVRATRFWIEKAGTVKLLVPGFIEVP